jgi:sarcosine oxidase, subunit beta
VGGSPVRGGGNGSKSLGHHPVRSLALGSTKADIAWLEGLWTIIWGLWSVARPMRVAVVGAGVLGASAAYELARGGAEVVLVEAAAPGAGTSSRGAGLVCEGMWHETSLALARRSLEILRGLSKLGEDEGWPFRFFETGSTTLVPARLVEAAARMAGFQRRHGAEAQLLEPDALRKLPHHGALRLDDVAAGVHYPRDGWAAPRALCEVRTSQLEAMGAEVVRAPASLAREGGGDGRVVVRAGDRALDADAVVLAAGVWTRALLRQAGLDAPLQAYRTQALRLAAPGAHELPILHDEVQGFYLRPAWPGQLVVGNGTTTRPEDPDRYETEADAAFLDASRRRLARRAPALAAARPTEGWAGVDAATPDRLMLAGPHPEARDVWLLAGGNGHGFMRAPAAGESLAAMLLRHEPRVDVGAYDPARFAGRMSAPFPTREGYTLEP